MNIVHILNHIEECGNGIVNVCVDLACVQAEQGHAVTVLSRGGSYEALLKTYNVQHIILNQSRSLSTLLTVVSRFRSAIKSTNPDIVHAHMVTGTILSRFSFVKRRYKLLATMHNEWQKSARLMRYADHVIAVSGQVKQHLLKTGFKDSKVSVICNGTLNSPRRTKHRRNQTQGEQPKLQHPNITTVAGMFQRKGISELLQAFKKVHEVIPSAHLYLVGNGDDIELFKSQAKELSISDYAHFEGFQSDAQHYLQNTDVFVLASHKDPCPLVLPEAREAGCAIVGTDVDGIPEALDYSEAGIIVPVQDVDALSAEIIKLLSSEEHLAEWRKRASKNLARLTINRVNDDHINLYKHVLSL